MFRAEIVKRTDEDGESSVDANNPGESKQEIDCRDKDGGLEYHFDGAHYCLSEGITQMAGSILFDSYHAENARSPLRLLIRWDAVVVVGFIEEKCDTHKADAGFDGIYPERPLPCEFRDDKGSEQGSKIRRSSNECRPNVDLTATKIVVSPSDLRH